MPKIGVIDMGTNTFHLLLAEVDTGRFHPIIEYKRAVRLGQGGISHGRLSDEGMGRALDCLQFFKEKALEAGLQPESLNAFATSAVRSAGNGEEFAWRVKSETGIHIQIIPGYQEAGLIFDGVRASGVMDDASGPILVMDIGGGSVEFILGEKDGYIHWLHSFELGGQRLLDRYMRQDPIRPEEAARLTQDMTEDLQPLAEACQAHPPTILAGASGTFDTLRVLQYPGDNVSASDGFPWKDLSIPKTDEITRHLQTLNRAQRLAIPGVSDLRADMIVVALLLLQVGLDLSQAPLLRQCSWALKEGVAYRLSTGRKV